MFRYRADLRPLLSIVTIVVLSLLPFLIHFPLWLLLPYAGVLLWLRSYSPYAQHNHGHLPVFRFQVLNLVYDALLAQCTGYATALWELHHVRGHHRHFLTPELDVARIIDRRTGRTMSRWYYAFRGNLTILRDSIRIAWGEHRSGRKSLLPKLTVELAIQAVLTVALAVWNPWMALLFFIIPNLMMSWFVWWESYPHHHGVPLTHAYDASVTITHRFFNWQTFNIGHHTAHHEKPTLHWSLLPERTAAIIEKIPAQCIRER
jgi:fatty acid desaturase